MCLVLELLGPDGLYDHFAALVQRKKKKSESRVNPTLPVGFSGTAQEMHTFCVASGEPGGPRRRSLAEGSTTKSPPVP